MELSSCDASWVVVDIVSTSSEKCGSDPSPSQHGSEFDTFQVVSPPKTECHPILRTYCSNPVVLRSTSRGKQSRSSRLLLVTQSCLMRSLKSGSQAQVFRSPRRVAGLLLTPRLLQGCSLPSFREDLIWISSRKTKSRVT